MLESLTIFSKGGLILYQYLSDPSLMEKERGGPSPQYTNTALNNVLVRKFLLDPTGHNKSFHIHDGLTLVWTHSSDGDKCIVAMYPDILFEGPRQYLREWATSLVEQTAREYSLYYEQQASMNAAISNAGDENSPPTIRPDPAPFDQTFRAILDQSKNNNTNTHKSGATRATTPAAADQKKVTTASTTTSTTKKSGKKERTWGDAKVTEQAMAALDRSKSEDTSADAMAAAQERTLAEARAAYLPTAQDLAQEEEAAAQAARNKNNKNGKDDSEPSWSSTAVGWFQQLTGNKVLEDSDLDKPLQEMENFLTTKNVAQEIAHQLCQAVRGKLVGKKLNSLYRVQTAVQQALETVTTKILHSNVDLLQNVLQKRGDGSLFGLSKTSKKAPYVIAVVGINGVGKSTSLAKLAYYFSQNGCKPLLVAGDTFRSGAVEQLKVHADCLNVPVFAQGYSKDPSSVAKAAIEHATQNGNDVVLIDTAGRMQNNVPLMKALGKLATENRPDFCLLVAEALVGHDGLSQYQMFSQALGRRGIDGLVVTKFDTVSTKVGATLTLTHETGVPIVFCGTGQKYHHLKKLNASDVVRTLFSA